VATHEIIIAGFGGQGVLTAGQLLAYAGLAEKKHVSWFPAYGPEQRGGTANCSVVLSDRPVSSPVVSEPTAVVAMNQPSVDRFEPLVRAGGALVVNTSLARRKSPRQDLTVVEVPATEIAGELGNLRVANLVAVGALLAATGAVRPESVLEALKKLLGPGKAALLPLNRKALERGLAIGRRLLAAAET